MKRLFALLIILALSPLSAQSTVRDCEELATQIGQDAGLPQHLLPAIARIESGRSLNGKRKAWPWALNHAGKGLYFETKSSALDYLPPQPRKGAPILTLAVCRSITIGIARNLSRWSR